MTLFAPFAEVPYYPLVFPLFWGAMAIFVLAMARHLRVFAAARAEGPSPFADIPRRFVGLMQYAFIQTKMFKDWRAGLMHAGIFWGFVLLTIGTVNIVTGGIVEQILSIPFDGLIWALVSVMDAGTEAARQLLYKACVEIDAGAPDASRWSAMCKLVAGDTAMRVTTDAVQVLGGYGYIDEFPVERMMRDAKITQLYEGTQQIQRLVIARSLLGKGD